MCLGLSTRLLIHSENVPVVNIAFTKRSMSPLVMTTFGKLGRSAESYMQSLADVALSTGFVDRGVWLRIAKLFMSFALGRGRGIVFRHYYKSIAKQRF